MLIFFPRIRTVGRWAVPRRPAPNPAIATVGTKEKAAHQTGEPLSLAVSIKLYAWAFLSPVVSPPFSLHYYIICVPHFIYFLRQSPSIFEHICLNGTHPKSRLSLETARLSPKTKTASSGIVMGPHVPVPCQKLTSSPSTKTELLTASIVSPGSPITRLMYSTSLAQSG